MDPENSSLHRPSSKVWGYRREKVKEAFISRWDAYSKYAWGLLSLFTLLFLNHLHVTLCLGANKVEFRPKVGFILFQKGSQMSPDGL
jgi:hypothetical protein